MRSVRGADKILRSVMFNVLNSRVLTVTTLWGLGGALSVTAAPPASKPPIKPGPKPTVGNAAQPAAKPATPPASKPAEKPVTSTPVVTKNNAAGLPVHEEKIGGTLVKFKMVRLPGGKVVVADPKDPGAGKEVEIKPFWIGETELSWDEFDVWMFKLDLSDEEGAKVDAKTRPSLPYGAPDRGYGHEGYPAISLTANAAQMYAKWLSQKTGRKYRLATEAEWEYACRAGAAPAKKSADEIQKVAWVSENSEEKTHPTGERPANAWGLFDMLGNAGEWVTGTDGVMVLKGGHYQIPVAKVNCAWRAKQEVSWHDPNKPKSNWWLADGSFAGFRLVRED